MNCLVSNEERFIHTDIFVNNWNALHLCLVCINKGFSKSFVLVQLVSNIVRLIPTPKKTTLKNRTLVLHWSRYSMKYAQFETSFAHTAVQHTGIACGKGLSKRPIIGLKTGKSPMTKLSHAWSKSMGRNDTISHTTTTYYYVLGNKNIGKMP